MISPQVRDIEGPGVEWTQSQIGTRSFSTPFVAGSMIFLDAVFMEGSGLWVNSRGLRLYLRNSCPSQLEFIRSIVSSGKKGVIYGQPGTGKSVLTFFATMIMPETEKLGILWIHFKDEGLGFIRCSIVNRTESSKSILAVDYEELCQNFDRIVVPSSVQGRLLLVLDGVNNTPSFSRILNISGVWVSKDPADRRLLFVTSMASIQLRTAVSPDFDKFTRYSWTLQEYLSAILNNDFFASIASKLDASKESDASAVQRVEDKYLYAGGNARYMFQYTTGEVIEFIRLMLDQQADIGNMVLKTSGNSATSLTNGLFNVYDNGDRSIVSEYAAREICSRLGPQHIQRLADLFSADESMNGTFLNYFFLANTNLGKVGLIHDDGIRMIVSEPGPVVVDGQDPTLSACPLDVWLTPTSPRNPGWDSVKLSIRGGYQVASFVQITRAKTHLVKLLPIKKFLTLLNERRIFDAESVEFDFIVPNENRESFSLGAIDNPRTLVAWGWPSTTWGITQKINIYGIDFTLRQ